MTVQNDVVAVQHGLEVLCLVVNQDIRAEDGRRLLGRTDAKRMNAVMLTCGTYDAAGEFAYRVGLPAQSGVGGGVLAVIPQHGTLCAWGPRLDAAGNSVAAIAALDEFTTASGLSVFCPAAHPLPAPGATAVISVPVTDVETHVCAPTARRPA